VLSFREALHKIVVVLTVVGVVAVTTVVVVAPVPLNGVKVVEVVLLMQISPEEEMEPFLIIPRVDRTLGVTILPATPAST
jgi:hypothetical protein